MGLNKQKGNMYEFVTHTWNAIKGKCPHECSYCYMKRWGEQPELHFDEKEMRADLGEGNYIFVGSSCDMFASACDMPESVPAVNGEWIAKILAHCKKFANIYYFQSKNPHRASWFKGLFPKMYIFCTTLESNRFYFLKFKKVPSINDRAKYIKEFDRRHITIEPILDFDLEEFVEMLRDIAPEQVNIGADSGNNNLPEPSMDKVQALIAELSKFTKVVQKKNLRRLLNEHK